MSNEELVHQVQQGINTDTNMTKIYMQNKGFIISIIKKYGTVCKHACNSVSIIEFDELIHEAYFGLVTAVDRYNSNQETLFTTYAAQWINQAVKRYLDNCGRVVRVPVHTQEKIFKYNRETSFFLQHCNRIPTKEEYSWALEVSEKEIEQLEKFMFQGKVKSLDYISSGTNEEDNRLLANTLASTENIESDVIEQITQEQIKNELWIIVENVLKNDAMNDVIRFRFIEGLTMKDTGDKLGITLEMVRHYESKAFRRLRCNSKTKRLFENYIAD